MGRAYMFQKKTNRVMLQTKKKYINLVCWIVIIMLYGGKR